jgi:hypothetical protein
MVLAVVATNVLPPVTVQHRLRRADKHAKDAIRQHLFPDAFRTVIMVQFVGHGSASLPRQLYRRVRQQREAYVTGAQGRDTRIASHDRVSRAIRIVPTAAFERTPARHGSKQGCFTGKSPTGVRVVDWEVAIGLQWGSHS